ncbi:TlpA family protein disulfide reductase [Niastella caeni]|uniref:TlpA family protein disulfide reductase n=1 Tax=Niastella caeni TaxID=2569763 RepID=A0A4S8HVZ7_9BACT|nr:TlpA disulfide reductase family protein [Niastella caeni]THU39371.1 TlpA family protein disulfide reductase [Niastella caeni]
MTRCIISILVLFAQVCHAQKQFTTLIRFPESIDTRKVKILYEDGKTMYPVPQALIKNKTTISGVFYSKYVTLAVLYPKTESTFHSNEFFLKEGHSSLVFSECRKGDSLAFPFDSFKLSNAIEIRRIPEHKKFHLFTQKETAEEEELNEKYASATEGKYKDSLLQLINAKWSNIVKKRLEFVSQNNDSYYYFWQFKRHFMWPAFIQKYYDTLKIVFASFPAALKNSFEGKEILNTMEGAMHCRKGCKALDFTAKDVSGATIHLSNYKGKYVLLQFWASWCGPCLDEMPHIKKIRESHSTDKLQVISISIDSDSIAFKKAMAANNITWTTLLDRSRDIYRKFGGNSIPSVFLINKEGIIVFSNREEPRQVLDDLLSTSIK